MTEEHSGFLKLARLVLDALEAADVEYLIGGAVALWAWGEVRTIQDFDLVVNLPVDRIAPLSQELEQHNMLVPSITQTDVDLA